MDRQYPSLNKVFPEQLQNNEDVPASTPQPRAAKPSCEVWFWFVAICIISIALMFLVFLITTTFSVIPLTSLSHCPLFQGVFWVSFVVILFAFVALILMCIGIVQASRNTNPYILTGARKRRTRWWQFALGGFAVVIIFILTGLLAWVSFMMLGWKVSEASYVEDDKVRPSPIQPLPASGPSAPIPPAAAAAAAAAAASSFALRDVGGLSAPVGVWRDRDGVAHIDAQTLADAYTALGYVHAQDRLFQMEVSRRSANGSMAALLGPMAVPIDMIMHTMGLPSGIEGATKALYAAAARVGAVSAEAAGGLGTPSGAGAARTAPGGLTDDERAASTLVLATAYSRGVNAWIDKLRRSTASPGLPMELGLMGVSVGDILPWSVRDCVAISRAMAYQMGGNMKTELARFGLWGQGLPYGEIMDLLAPYPGWNGEPYRPYASGATPTPVPQATATPVRTTARGAATQGADGGDALARGRDAAAAAAGRSVAAHSELHPTILSAADAGHLLSSVNRRYVPWLAGRTAARSAVAASGDPNTTHGEAARTAAAAQAADGLAFEETHRGVGGWDRAAGRAHRAAVAAAEARVYDAAMGPMMRLVGAGMQGGGYIKMCPTVAPPGSQGAKRSGSGAASATGKSTHGTTRRGALVFSDATNVSRDVQSGAMGGARTAAAGGSVEFDVNDPDALRAALRDFGAQLMARLAALSGPGALPAVADIAAVTPGRSASDETTGTSANVALSAAFAAAATAPLSPFATAKGSNGWVWSDGSGASVVSSDPHLDYSTPMVWYPVQIRVVSDQFLASPAAAAASRPGGATAGQTAPRGSYAGGGGTFAHAFDGVSLAGMPGVVIGRTDRVAWGITVAATDAEDVFVLTTDPARPCTHAIVGGRSTPLIVRTVTVDTRGGGTASFLVRESPLYGPIVNPAFGIPGPAMALRSPATQPDPSPLVAAALDFALATDVVDMQAALTRLQSPALSVVFGDSRGGRGWVATGDLPLRMAARWGSDRALHTTAEPVPLDTANASAGAGGAPGGSGALGAGDGAYAPNLQMFNPHTGLVPAIGNGHTAVGAMVPFKPRYLRGARHRTAAPPAPGAAATAPVAPPLSNADVVAQPGWIVVANNAPLPLDFPFYLGADFYGYRAYRLAVMARLASNIFVSAGREASAAEGDGSALPLRDEEGSDLAGAARAAAAASLASQLLGSVGTAVVRPDGTADVPLSGTFYGVGESAADALGPHMQMQLSTHLPMWDYVGQSVLVRGGLVRRLTPHGRTAQAMLASWDGVGRVGDERTTLAMLWLRELGGLAAGLKIFTGQYKDSHQSWTAEGQYWFVTALFLGGDAITPIMRRLCVARVSDDSECIAFAADALERAHEDVIARRRAGGASRMWGSAGLGEARFEHAQMKAVPLDLGCFWRRTTAMGSLPTCPSVANVANGAEYVVTAGASMRMISLLRGPWDGRSAVTGNRHETYFAMPMGASGHGMSRYLDNLLERYAKGEYLVWSSAVPMSQSAVLSPA